MVLLFFGMLMNQKIISEIKEINCTWCWNIITKISNDLLIIVGKEFIYLISINEYNLIRKIDINSPCYSVCYLINGNLLTGHSNGYIKQWNLNNNIFNFIGENKMHDYEIRVISQLKNNMILSGSSDKINIYQIE